MSRHSKSAPAFYQILFENIPMSYCYIYKTRGGFDHVSDHVTYGLWRTKILKNCSKLFKTVEVLVLILIFIQMWRTSESFLNPSLKTYSTSNSIIFLAIQKQMKKFS